MAVHPVPETPQLRRATPADSPATLAFIAAVRAELGVGANDGHADDDLSDFESQYFSRGGDFVVLADRDGRIVGSCGIFPLGNGTVELRKMYLIPALRGRGQGRRLMEWALVRGRELGFRRMTLETARVLTDAIALYERNGFKPDAAGLHSRHCEISYSRDL